MGDVRNARDNIMCPFTLEQLKKNYFAIDLSEFDHPVVRDGLVIYRGDYILSDGSVFVKTLAQKWMMLKLLRRLQGEYDEYS